MKSLALEGKVAIVTGGARGIGRAICELYAAEGAKVAVADINLKEAEATALALGDFALAVQPDVTRQESINGMVSCVLERGGAIDILVRNVDWPVSLARAFFQRCHYSTTLTRLASQLACDDCSTYFATIGRPRKSLSRNIQ